MRVLELLVNILAALVLLALPVLAKIIIDPAF